MQARWIRDIIDKSKVHTLLAVHYPFNTNAYPMYTHGIILLIFFNAFHSQILEFDGQVIDFTEWYSNDSENITSKYIFPDKPINFYYSFVALPLH